MKPERFAPDHVGQVGEFAGAVIPSMKPERFAPDHADVVRGRQLVGAPSMKPERFAPDHEQFHYAYTYVDPALQ